LRIVGSHKGLLCFFDTNFYSNVGHVLLWNPSISRFKKLGHDPCRDLDKVSHFVVGFGFVLRNLEFKVVKIVYGLDNVNRVFVYELSSDSWRKIDGVVVPCDKNHLIIYYETLDYINHIYSLRSPNNTSQETLKLDPPYKPLHGYLRIVGSHKGLLCFFDTNFYSNVGHVLLWNPSISRFKKLGHDPCRDLDKVSHFVVGFGFVLRNLEFKVVKIVYGLDNVNRVFVYELSSDSWRKIDGVVVPC
nr:hypothetical protein [Tanacetum cinerariifolium]